MARQAVLSAIQVRADAIAQLLSELTRLFACACCVRSGRYQQEAGSTSCLPCAASTSVDTPGQTACFECSTGTFANITGLSVCFNCPVGRFGPQGGLTQCSQCAAGSYSLAARQSVCTNCEPGAKRNATDAVDSLMIFDLFAGKFAGVAGQTLCGQCNEGTYQPLPGQTVCQKCSVGAP